MLKILVLGASSSIARALALRFAVKNNARLFLAAREGKEAERIATDLAIRTGASTHWEEFEATDYANHESLITRAVEKLGGLDGVILAFGVLGDAGRAATDPYYACYLIEQNLTAAAFLLTLCGQRLARQRSGFIIVLGSVAGDRGRRTNYVYGCAKAGLAVFAQGLRAELNESNVHVLTVKLGLVDTRMAFGRSPRWLAVSPDTAADAIYRAWRKKAYEVYIPWYWRPIMALIRAIPEKIFKHIRF